MIKLIFIARKQSVLLVAIFITLCIIALISMIRYLCMKDYAMTAVAAITLFLDIVNLINIRRDYKIVGGIYNELIGNKKKN